MMIRSSLIRVLLLSFPTLWMSFNAGAGDALQPVRDRGLDLSRYELKTLYENDFSRPQKIARGEDLIEKTGKDTFRRKALPSKDAEWIAEGWGGAEIRDGKLNVAPSPFDAGGEPVPVAEEDRSHMVLWNRNVFPADFLLEFDVNHCGSTDGLTLMFFSATGKRGEDIFDLSLPARRADYRTYNSGEIANYTVSYWSLNSSHRPEHKQYQERFTCRLRKNPGKNLVASGHSRTNNANDRDHKIRVLKIGNRIEVEVNGKVVVQWEDPAPKPLGEGRIGLRCMSGVAQVRYDNFKVWSVEKKGDR